MLMYESIFRSPTFRDTYLYAYAGLGIHLPDCESIIFEVSFLLFLNHTKKTFYCVWFF